MLRLVIIFILGIITIPYIQCQLDDADTTFSTESSEITVTDTSEDNFSDPTQTDSSDTEETSSAATTTEISDSSTDSISIIATTEESTTAITDTDTDSTDDTTLSTATDSIDDTTLSTVTDSTDTTTLSIDTDSTDTTTLSIATDSTDTTTLSIDTDSTDTTVLTDSSTTTSSSSSETSSDTTNSVSVNTDEQTSTTPVTFETTTSVTTQQPITPLYKCYFTEPCYGNIVLNITDGYEFNPPKISENTEPPVAPTSDVSSITKETNNGELCKLPYPLKLDDSTELTKWNMWFCYDNDCPTEKADKATCAEGSYGLLSITPQETSKTTIDALDLDVTLGNSLEQQCLRFYYYFTVRDQQDLGQNIQIWLRPNKETESQSLLKNLIIAEMSENSWHYEEISIDSGSSPYTLSFLFEVDANNPADDVGMDKTIYFALDNLEFYEYSCSYVNGSTTTVTPLTTTTTSVQPTTTVEKGSDPPPSNLGTIIGISLGIGIPVLLIVIGGTVLYQKKNKSKDTDNYGIPLTSRNAKANDDVFKNPYLF